MPEDTPDPPPSETTREASPPEQPAERHVELSEHFRKGTEVFPIVNMAPDDVQPLLSADPPPPPPADSDG